MALIPPFFLDCVVALGRRGDDGQTRWIASGFLYGHFAYTLGDGRKHYRVYLVTNRHVVANTRELVVRCNPQGRSTAKSYVLSLLDNEGSRLWFAPDNPDLDVVAVPVNYQILKSEGMQIRYFHSDENCALTDTLVQLGVTEGDYVYVLGFPMGLIGGGRNAVIARGGIIARIRDMFEGASAEFLLDSLIFPGNSGGPIISKPEAMAIRGTKSQTTARLIGVVKSYVPYRDVAISQQTGRPRVVFEENSGLAAGNPVDGIEEAISRHLEQQAGILGLASVAEYLDKLQREDPEAQSTERAS